MLTREELLAKISETQELGGTQILLQGGLHPDKPLEFYEDMLRFMKETGIHVHGFSPPEICHFAEISALTTLEVVQRLMAAGLDSMPGGGAEILTDRVRDMLAPRKCSADRWIAVMEEAHGLGMRTTATMMFGHVETIEERLEHLQRLRPRNLHQINGLPVRLATADESANTVGAPDRLDVVAVGDEVQRVAGLHRSLDGVEHGEIGRPTVIVKGQQPAVLTRTLE